MLAPRVYAGMEKLTLFEMHFDGARFGQTTLGDGVEETSGGDETTAAPSRSGGRRLLRFITAGIVLSAIGTAIARRFLGREPSLELDEDVEDIAVETVDA